jgi:hypothetical protein
LGYTAWVRHRLRPLVGRKLWLLMTLFALTGFVVTQPLLDVLGRSPDFFLFRQAGAADIVLLAVTITLLPPLLLWGIAELAGVLGERFQRLVSLLMVAGLLGLLGLEVAKKATPLRGSALLAVGVLVALGGGALYAKGGGVRLWLRFLSPAPIVFLLVFLLVSPVAVLLRPQRAPAAELATASGGKPGPIVFLLMDEFPLMSLLDHRGQIDQRLYPNFAKLQAGSTWYRNASAVTGMTGWALPSLLTGRYPVKDRLPIASQFPDNLFTLLGDSYHYKLHVFEGMSQLCPPRTCPDAKRSGAGDLRQLSRGGGGFRGVLRAAAGVWGQIVSTRDPTEDAEATLEEATVDSADGDDSGAAGPAATADPDKRAAIVKGYKRGVNFQRFLSSIRRPTDPDERALYFVHVLIPHQPWKYLPSGRRYPERSLGQGRLSTAGRWVSEPWPVETVHQRHLMQTAIADRYLGDLVQRLRETGLYDRSLLVVTADHGMAFEPGQSGRASVTNATAPQVLWVPLFIKRPGQRAGSTNDVNWEHVDLLPTIADLKGLRVPWAVDGVSWADPSRPERQRTQKFFDTRPGLRRVFDGPSNQAIVRKGVTDRMVRPDDGYLGWFEFGPHADLVGRRVDTLPVEPGAGTAKVVGLDDYSKVDLTSGTVPAQVGGQLVKVRAGTPQRPSVVAAINGVIGGVSETFASGGSPPTWFTTMVPDSLMRQGANSLQLFLLDTSAGKPSLQPLTLTT